MLRTLSYFFLLNIAFAAHAFDLVGTWQLLSIERLNTNGQWQNDDCHAPKGMIIYTVSGDMAAGLNCMNAQDAAPGFAEHDAVFYVGTYTRQDNLILHHVQNSSSPIYYGTTQTRELEILNDHEMFLRVKSKTGEYVKLKWRKEK